MTYRSGSSIMLSLIYSEILKMLRLWGLVDFDCEIFFPHDLHDLPRGYNKQKSKESDQACIMTTETLLEEVLPYLNHITCFGDLMRIINLFDLPSAVECAHYIIMP